MRLLKEEKFMENNKINVILKEYERKDVLEFQLDENKLLIDLNNKDQTNLRKVFYEKTQ